MEAVIRDERFRFKQPNTGLTGANNSSDISHDDPMTKAEREEMAELKELVHQQIALASLNAKTQPQIQVQTSSPNKWLMVSLAIITMFSGATSFVGNSGIWIGDRNRDSQEVKEMKNRLDNLRTLYLIRFGEDPDKVTPETMTRKLQSAQEKK